jgi:hypothetical protein
MLMPTPVTPQKINLGMSAFATRSLLKGSNRENKANAPVTRNTINPLGPTKSGIKPLATR